MNLKSFFNPRSVAIIGASSKKEKVGAQILNNLIAGKFRGKIFPVNLHEKTIAGLPAYRNVGEIQHEVDLAIIVIPSQFVVPTISECALRGIKNIIIISAGFSEVGREGRAAEEEIKYLAKKHHLNILGPNCMGIISSNGNLNVTFAKSQNKKGNVAFISQSGAIGSAALDWVQDKDFGFSYFISLGNKAVLDENDFFEYFKHDSNTDMVVAYLEEIRDGERFLETVSSLSGRKPVVILKSGKSDIGKKAAMSHTGSLAGSYEASLAAFKRANVINALTIKQIFILIKCLKNAIKVNRKNWTEEIYVISNAGGPMVATVDLMSDRGLKLGKFSKKLTAELRKKLPGIKTIQNPFDIIGDAPAQRYQIAMETILKEKNINNVLVLLTPQTATEINETAKIIARLNKKYRDKMICTSFIGGQSLWEAKSILAKNDVVNFNYPHEAVECLAHYINYQKNKGEMEVYKKSISRQKTVKSVSSKPTNNQGGQLDYLNSFKLLKEYNIPTIPTSRINNSRDLDRLKYPIVMKVVGPNLIHKTDKGSIALNIKDKTEAQKVLRKFSSLLKQAGNYVVAQPMDKGFELILGMKRDKSFGPIIMAGAGGIYAEVFKDVQIEVNDVDLKRAKKMIEALKIYPILKGTRGQAGYNINALAKAIVNLAKMANDYPEIKEIDVNPLFITPKGVRAIDVRIIR